MSKMFRHIWVYRDGIISSKYPKLIGGPSYRTTKLALIAHQKSNDKSDTAIHCPKCKNLIDVNIFRATTTTHNRAQPWVIICDCGAKLVAFESGDTEKP